MNIRSKWFIFVCHTFLAYVETRMWHTAVFHVWKFNVSKLSVIATLEIWVPINLPLPLLPPVSQFNEHSCYTLRLTTNTLHPVCVLSTSAHKTVYNVCIHCHCYITPQWGFCPRECVLILIGFNIHLFFSKLIPSLNVSFKIGGNPLIP